MRLTQWIDEFRDDVRFAVRQLRSSAAVSSIAAITLALGIGANSAIFALVDRTLLRPLPFHNPDRLVMAWEQSDSSPRGRVSPLNLLDWNERSRTFDQFAAFIPNIGGMVMNGADEYAETVIASVGDRRILRRSGCPTLLPAGRFLRPTMPSAPTSSS